VAASAAEARSAALVIANMACTNPAADDTDDTEDSDDADEDNTFDKLAGPRLVPVSA
jgi:hypothetical protein